MIRRIHSTSSTMTKLGKIICQFLKVLLLSMLIHCYVLDHGKCTKTVMYNCIHNFLLMVSLKLHFFRTLHELVIKQSNLVSNLCILYLLQHNLSYVDLKQ